MLCWVGFDGLTSLPRHFAVRRHHLRQPTHVRQAEGLSMCNDGCIQLDGLDLQVWSTSALAAPNPANSDWLE